jgi:uncharacterized membrane protein
MNLPMHWGHLSYLPITPGFFSVLVGIFIILALLIQLGALGYAYRRIGLSPRTAMLVLVGSLVGSMINIPILELPEEQIAAGRVVTVFGMQYVVPEVVDWPGTVVAANVGGALIPIFVSLYLLNRNRLWARGLMATACIAIICYMLARPVPGVGIALPMIVPPLATAFVALLLSRDDAAPLAYIGGSLGTLIGADLMNLGNIRGLGAPVASIGGAGTFDGIFLTAIIAVLIASIPRRRLPQPGPWGPR